MEDVQPRAQISRGDALSDLMEEEGDWVQPHEIDQILTLLADQPKTIAALTAGLPDGRLHRPPARGEWSVNDVLAHLRSCDDMWGK